MHSSSLEYNSTDTILMVRPVSFGLNTQTLADNSFQNGSDVQNLTQNEIKSKGKQQFDKYVEQLRKQGVDVIVVQDTLQPAKPDAIFPNNWFTTHPDNTITLYPMKSISRRLERNIPVLDQLSKLYKINVSKDYSNYQNQSIFLEGTGSMVLDHQNKVAYACISERTHEQLFKKVCQEVFNYQPIFFQAKSSKGIRYYHTNVLMSVASDFIIIGLNQISLQDKEKVQSKVMSSIGSKKSKQIIQISEQQINNFCANVLEVKNKKGDKILTMSKTAYQNFTQDQLKTIQKYCQILQTDIPSIQKYGGGGSRCMMAQVFLKK